MYLHAIGTAIPDRRYTKRDCWTAFAASDWFARLDVRSHAIAQLILSRDNGIENRWLSVDSLDEVFVIDADTLHRRFAAHAPRLAANAGRSALARAEFLPADIDAVIVTTCTGYLCPGLSSYVIERLGLPRNVLAFDLVGQGCAGVTGNQAAYFSCWGSAGIVAPVQITGDKRCRRRSDEVRRPGGQWCRGLRRVD